MLRTTRYCGCSAFKQQGTRDTVACDSLFCLSYFTLFDISSTFQWLHHELQQLSEKARRCWMLEPSQ